MDTDYLIEEINDLKYENRILRDALSWYANNENWKSNYVDCGKDGIGKLESNAVQDNGKRAFDTLTSI